MIDIRIRDLVFIIIIANFISACGQVNYQISTSENTNKLVSMSNQPLPREYVIHNNCYYIPTSEQKEITVDQLGNEIGPINRIGNQFPFFEEGDTTIFLPRTDVMYTLKGIDPKYQIVVKTKNKTGYSYQLMVNDGAVKQSNKDNIFVDKDMFDKPTLDIVLHNVERVNKYFYELNKFSTRSKIMEIDYDPKTGNTELLYDIPDSHGTFNGFHLPGTLRVLEYNKENKGSLHDSFYNTGNPNQQLPIENEFDRNGIHWVQYGKKTMFVGTKGDMYYELILNGIPDKVMDDILDHFSAI